MAYQNYKSLGTLLAASSLTGSQYLFAKVDSAGKIAVAGAGELAIGVIENKPGAGEPVTVAIYGVIKVKAGATFAAGAKIAANAAGKAITATTGQQINGIALEAAGAVDQVVSVLLVRAGVA